MTRRYRIATKLYAYKQLKNCAEKARFLHEKYSLPRCFILEKKVCTADQWKRMIQAMKAGRSVGVRGRPPKLTSAQKAEIEEKALKRSITPVPMTSADINALVFVFSFLSIFSSTVYRQTIRQYHLRKTKNSGYSSNCSIETGDNRTLDADGSKVCFRSPDSSTLYSQRGRNTFWRGCINYLTITCCYLGIETGKDGYPIHSPSR